MSLDLELQNALSAFTKRATPTIAVEVVSVDKKKGICRVKDDSIEYNVRLTATEVENESEKRFYLFPKVGSSILIAPIEEDMNRYYIVAYSEVESFDYKVGEVHFLVNAEGFLLKKENETLKALMADLIATIKRMKFTTNTGSTIKLVNEPEFTALEKRFNHLLNDN
ncbi:hypothetical protein EDM00_11090 [Ornithobacterium rhinotracheale]|uniref:hypothetical protein n=1 Tax=Ornithobacterium rhinotracheale TaxID=28251 RepID=UPI00129C2914|nr:hypothetical protein [Ornithobacterium rhinotracheale]MRI64525.1 hypothetical protein [Ornithobacterium rhinotracheale]